MRRIQHRVVLCAAYTIIAVALVSALLLPLIVIADNLPIQLKDAAFWQMVTDLSEPDGFFQFENYISNEDSYQLVIPRLNRTTKPGGVYVGVGPEQNFTYIAALRPKMSFIVDIRRQNLLEHLLYKSLFELSVDRADFLGRLFSLKRPSGLGSGSSVSDLFHAYAGSVADEKLYDANLKSVLDHLTRQHGFPLSVEDRKGIDKVYSAFFYGGPTIDYNYMSSDTSAQQSTSYRDLMMSSDSQGQDWSYLATEENFHIVRDLQRRNLIIPLVGDFAGPKTIRSLGKYLTDRNAPVTVFYTSNVDTYLFENNVWKAFYANAAALPMSSSSTFIRTLNARGRGLSVQIRGFRTQWTSLLCPMPPLIQGVATGQVQTPADVNQMCK
jgi:hypothetical protein